MDYRVEVAKDDQTIEGWLDDNVIDLADLPLDGTQSFKVAVGEPD